MDPEKKTGNRWMFPQAAMLALIFSVACLVIGDQVLNNESSHW